MQVPCPSCQHPLLIGSDVNIAETSQIGETISGVDCPNCGFVPLESIPDEEPGEVGRQDHTISYDSQLNYAEAKQISHFALVRLLGQGGFGTVWLADDVNLNRQVALKLPVSRTRDLAGLLHEAQAAAHLRHPNIVSVYEVGTEEDQVFIASEYVEGMTLKDLLSTGKPPIRRTIDTLIAITDALEHAHSTGIIHRDVKPANILLNAAGQPFVTDFGLAKRVSTESTETTISSEGQILGTARYMSPEQASGKTKETDHRSDIYALGVILFEMLTGHVPFRGNMRAVLHQKIFDDPPSPRSLDPTLPKDLETICLKCLERDADKRYASAGELADELRRFRAGEPIFARPISTPERLWRWCRRRPQIASLLIGLFTSMAVGGLTVAFYWRQAEHNGSLLRESLYRAQMTLASEYVGHGDIESLQQTLIEARRGSPEKDLRGFEWYYYNALIAPLKPVADHGGFISDIAVTTDGSRIATAGKDKAVRVWNADDGSLIRTLTLEKGQFRSLAFAPNSNQLATASSDGKVRIWNPSVDGEPLREIPHGPPVAFVRFSPDGKTLLSAGNAGAVRLWDVRRETLLDEIPTGKSGTKDILYSPDGSIIVIATEDERVRLRDAETNEILHILEPNPNVVACAISDDNSLLVTAAYNGTLRIWSVADGELRFTQSTNLGLIGDLEFLPESSKVVIASSSGELTIYDTKQRHFVRRVFSHYLTDGVLDRSADGRFFAVGSGDGSIKLVETELIRQPDVCWHDAHVRGVAIIDDEHFIAASGDGEVRRWPINGGAGQTLIAAGGPSLTHLAARAGEQLLAIASSDSSVRILDLDSLDTVREPVMTAKGAAAMQFCPGGQTIAIAGNDGTLTVLPLDSGSGTTHEHTFDHPLTAITFAPDGQSAFVALEDGSVFAFQPGNEDGNVERLLQIDDVPRTLEVCSATSVLAVGTDEGMIELWDLNTQSRGLSIKAHTSRISVLRVLPDGRTLVSGGRDRQLRMWDTQSGELVTKLNGHDRQVFCIAVTSDGETLISGDLEGAIRLWRAPRDD